MKPMPYTPPAYGQTVADKPAITWQAPDRTRFIFDHELEPHLAAKRLSSAECAAHYHQARGDWLEGLLRENNAYLPPPDLASTETRERMLTWDRFKITPHAFGGPDGSAQ